MKLVLPFPPSTNNLFLNARAKGGRRVISARYRDWRERATQAMWGQRIETFGGPVRITMVFEDNGRCDLDNLQKGLLDHLVHHRIIQDDSRKFVRELWLKWGPVKGVEITIEGAECPAGTMMR